MCQVTSYNAVHNAGNLEYLEGSVGRKTLGNELYRLPVDAVGTEVELSQRGVLLE